MSICRKHETLPPRLKLKRRYPIEEINIEARKKNQEEGVNGVLRLCIIYISSHRAKSEAPIHKFII